MKIIDLESGNEQTIQQAAAILVEGFKQHWPNAWPDMESALQEVRDSFGRNHISRVAVEDTGAVLGWIGGTKQYKGHVWELHPLVVNPKYQRRGIGRALVADLEEQVRLRGGLTLWLGTDDEDDMTSLAGVNLYPNVWEHVAAIQNLRDHPYQFYQKLGFSIIGVLPDANGPGKPDIFMAKSVKR